MGVSATAGDKYAVSGAVASVVDLTTGMPLSNRSLPPARAAAAERGASVMPRSPGAKGWDRRFAKSGLFGSFGANGGDPSPPTIAGWAAKHTAASRHTDAAERPMEMDADELARLEAAAAAEEAATGVRATEAADDDGPGLGRGDGTAGAGVESLTDDDASAPPPTAS